MQYVKFNEKDLKKPFEVYFKVYNCISTNNKEFFLKKFF